MVEALVTQRSNPVVHRLAFASVSQDKGEPIQNYFVRLRAVAVDGYHSVPLDKESQPLSTFITEWGRFMYLRMPQGYLASGDAYTRRYDELIKDVPRKVKIVDDTLLYDSNIEGAFFHTDFLLHCAKNGIVLNREKFQFFQDTVQF